MTAKNLFLEGVPGCGKSTIIESCIRPVKAFAGGYRTARVFSSAGEHRGFAQFPADSDKGIRICSDETLPTQFLVFDDGPGKNLRMEVFRDFTCGILEKSLEECERGERKFIVLDETGGLELQDERIYDVTMKALDSLFPCIGVIKCQDHAKALMGRKTETGRAYENYLSYYESIHKREDTSVIQVSTENRDNVRSEVMKWMKERILV